MKKVAFIGTGIMGSHMALHIARKYDVTVYNRTIEKAKRLEPYVKVSDSVEHAVEDADYIITILGYPSDVDEVYTQIFKFAKKGVISVDMTTSSPTLALKNASMGGTLGMKMLDAPVTGGDLGAKNATLSIMVGGNQDAYNEILPLLELVGSNIKYVGDAGNGQLTKLANQIAIAGTLLGVCESLAFASSKKLDLNAVYEILSSGSAASTQFKVNGLNILKDNFNPGFYVKHFLKDLLLAKEESKLNTPILDVAINLLKDLISEDLGEMGTQILYKKFI